MTYTEREIARLEGMKDGLIKKLVEECEDINDQIIALRKGTPRKKESEIYFDRGYAKGKTDAINAIKNDLNKRLTEEMNKPYQDQGLCQGLYFGIQRCDWYLDDGKENWDG